MNERAEAFDWAAGHVAKWGLEMTSQDKRQIAGWVADQLSYEAERLRSGLPDTDEGRERAVRIVQSRETDS